jgi:hypothetical protein
MSLSQKLIDTVDQLEIRFQLIDGGTSYHNTIAHNNIYTEHKSYEEVDSYPAISISSIETGESEAMDQITFQSSLMVEVYGYINKETDVLKETLKLLQDMEKAIYTDPALNENIFDLSLTITAATMDTYGLVKMNLRANILYTIS